MNRGATQKPGYEAILSALGRFLDKQGTVKDISIIEFQDGIIVQGLQHASSRYHTTWTNETWVFDNEEIRQLES
ncbi:MAG: hypothetical protein GXP41_06175 [Chloroflexi bacterium]|nr:hypothetical protein [Chloroflexota bacterium]